MVRQYTPIKYEFDELTAEWFRARGYITEILSSPCFCDVVAYHRKLKRFAICEVKSPREIDAMPSWLTEYNVKGLRRKKILEQIKQAPGYKDDPGLWRLYSFTLSSQLFTYYKSSEEHLNAAKKRNSELERINFKKFRVVAYLSIPVENEKVVRKVVGYFKGQGWIKSARFNREGRLVVVTVQY
jgi:hypothetical protein